MLRRRRAPRTRWATSTPRPCSPRFSRSVADALDARRRYADVLAGVRDGPVRERLADGGGRLDAGVAAVWDIAQRATQVERTLAALDPERVTDEYKRAKRGGADPELEAALAQRFGSVQRLLNALDDTDERLRLLDARLGRRGRRRGRGRPRRVGRRRGRPPGRRARRRRRPTWARCAPPSTSSADARRRRYRLVALRYCRFASGTNTARMMPTQMSE